MSEDEDEKKPSKLKLSAKGKETDGGEQGDAPTGPTNPHQDQAENRSSEPTKLKLRQNPKENKGAPEKPKEEEDAPPEPAAGPEQEKPKLRTRPSADDPSTPDAGETANLPETFEDGGDRSKPNPTPQEEKEIAPAKTPPPLPAQETVPLEEPPAEDLEEAVRHTAGGPGSTSSSPWLSVIIVVILFAILGGSGLGLWYVLKAPGERPTEVTESERPVDESDASADQSEGNLMTKSIARAKEAVESVPTDALDEVTSVEPPSPEQTPPPQEDTVDSVKRTTTPPAPPSQTSEDPAKSTEPEPEPGPTTATAGRKIEEPGSVDQTLVQAVSAYLSKVHIGGVRSGERPMVIIDDESYTPGDVVEPETGLRFSGIRNGKLAFTDENTVVYLKSF